MSLQSHAVVPVLLFLSRRLTACHGHLRSRSTSLPTLCLYYSQVCRVKDWKYWNRWNGSPGRLVWVYSNEEQPPRKVFLRGSSPLKVFPPEDDAWRLVACHPCGCQAGGVLRHRFMTASFPLVYRWGRGVHCIVGVVGSLTTRHDLVISCKRGGTVSVVSRNPKDLLVPVYSETNHANLTN